MYQTNKSLIAIIIFAALFIYPFRQANAYYETIINDITLSDGLEAHWSMDEENGLRIDSKGGHNLQEHGEVNSSPGKIGRGAYMSQLEGSFLYIEDALGAASNDSYSFSLWLKLNQEPSENSFYTVLSRWINDSVQGTYFKLDTSYRNNTKKRRLYYGSDAEYIASVEGTISTSVFEHYVCVINKNNNKGYLYKDGLLVADTVIGSGDAHGTEGSFLQVGNYKDGNGNTLARQFDGIIDEVGLWNRALTGDEVLRLYNDGKGLPYSVEPEEPEGNSSVAFFHGIAGSRLYTPGKKKGENQIWETVDEKDLQKLQMKNDGTALHQNTYTRDVIETLRPVTSWWDYSEGYESFMYYLDSLVEDEVIEEWEEIPYDWRHATDEIFKSGEKFTVEAEGDRIYYTTGEKSVPYILRRLEVLANNSPTGKVTIIAHSNGGLLVKNLIKYLEENEHDLLDKIDTVALVAVPQLGTPKAVGEILHGSVATSKGLSREAMENMPGMYGLLPTEEIVNGLSEPIIEVSERVKDLKPFDTFYDTEVTSYEDLRKFMLGELAKRNEPAPKRFRIPNVVKEGLLEKSESMHESIDDWSTEADIRVVEVVGTGLPTPRGVYYTDCILDGCTTMLNYTTHEWRFDMDGDGTVLTPSADGGKAGDTMYIPLNNASKDDDENYRHANILSSYIVKDLLRKNVIEGDESYPQDREEPPVDYLSPRFAARMYSPADMHINLGTKHTGIVYDGLQFELGREYEEEVPTSYYEEWGTTKYVGSEFFEGDNVVLEIKGVGYGTFRLVVDILEGNELVNTYVFTGVPVGPNSEGLIELSQDGIPTLQYDVDGDGEYDAELLPNTEIEKELLWELIQKTFEKDIPKKLQKWIDNKMEIIEKLLLQNKKGTLHAVEMQLEEIYRALER